jgi:hypothetical protein
MGMIIATIIYISYIGRRATYAASNFFTLFFVVSLGFLYPVSNAYGFEDL